jgi:Rrf2 family transcriptional regulator, cysteine metabolism repressor
MKISTKTRYGTRAVVEIASHYGKLPVKRKTIVNRHNIPDSYLENILLILKANGIIITKRGVSGGYVLSRKPSEITLLEIVNIFEGSLVPVACLENSEICEQWEVCSTRDVWMKLKEAQERVLKNITIGDLVSREKEKRQRLVNYVI